MIVNLESYAASTQLPCAQSHAPIEINSIPAANLCRYGVPAIVSLMMFPGDRMTERKLPSGNGLSLANGPSPLD
jgi:hypothetical protein